MSAPFFSYVGAFDSATENYETTLATALSAVGVSAPTGTQEGSFQYEAIRYIIINLLPLLQLINIIFFVIGFCLVMMGLSRLRQSVGGNAGQRSSPMGTFFYFLSGTILMNYAPFLVSISNSLFTFGTSAASGTYTSANLLFYVNEIGNTASQPDIITHITFALLMIVGVFSFARGLVLLVKLGEGSQEPALPKAITHLVAGIIAVNAKPAFEVMKNFATFSSRAT